MKINDLKVYLDNKQAKGVKEISILIAPEITDKVRASVQIYAAANSTFANPMHSTVLCTVEAWNGTVLRLRSDEAMEAMEANQTAPTDKTAIDNNPHLDLAPTQKNDPVPGTPMPAHCPQQLGPAHLHTQF
jgi:hypothetical protein